MPKYTLTTSQSRRINAEAVVQLGEAMLADGTVQRGTPEYRSVLRTVASAKRRLLAVDIGGRECSA